MLKGLAKICRPTLVVSSDRSCSPLRQIEPRLEAISGAQVVVISGALNAAPSQHPGEFNAMLRTFLFGHSRMAADDIAD